jgi:hypothetical protein
MITRPGRRAKYLFLAFSSQGQQVLPLERKIGQQTLEVDFLDNAFPVHPVHKMQKLVLLGRQGGKGGKQRIPCIHAYLSLCRRKSIACKIWGRQSPFFGTISFLLNNLVPWCPPL